MSESVLTNCVTTYGFKAVPSCPERVSDGFQRDLKLSLFLESPKCSYDLFLNDIAAQKIEFSWPKSAL